MSKNLLFMLSPFSKSIIRFCRIGYKILTHFPFLHMITFPSICCQGHESKQAGGDSSPCPSAENGGCCEGNAKFWGFKNFNVILTVGKTQFGCVTVIFSNIALEEMFKVTFDVVH